MFLRFKVADAPATTLHERFEQQVKLYPRATALECDGVQLTYREVNQDANRMARRLATTRVGADGLVLVAMERSCELVVAMLAVLKAGGSFVLLDDAPFGQRDAFLKKCGADTVITDSTRAVVPNRLRVVRYYAASGLDNNLERRIHPDRWACELAGKIRTHEAVLKILDAASHEHEFQAGDGLFSAMDLSGLAAIDLLLPLLTGGRLVLASWQEMRDPVRLDAAVRASNCKFVRLANAQSLSVGPALTRAAFA